MQADPISAISLALAFLLDVFGEIAVQSQRFTQTTSISLTQCPICNQVHNYDFNVLIQEIVGVMHMMTSRVESRTCAVTCPAKGGSFMVDVPVTLWSGQKLLKVA